MLVRIKKNSEPLSSEITPKSSYLSRRQFMAAAGAIAAAPSAMALMSSGQPRLPSPSFLGNAIHSAADSPYGKDLKPAPYDVVTKYNNFYEFGYGKSDPEKYSSQMVTDPWSITVSGECEKPGTYTLEDVLKSVSLEERIYRLRCVEAWSMVIPWVGFPLADLLKRFKPLSTAKYVEFKTLNAPDMMPGQASRFSTIDWPYQEGLRMDEAMNPLTLMAVGLYGDVLPNQNGAPIRLVVPWKYGFKSIKSIVSIRFTETMPGTSWSQSAPNEYGFYANVNPEVDHPRWSQATERRLPSGLFSVNRIDTKPFNGYGEEVADLYRDMDLRKFY